MGKITKRRWVVLKELLEKKNPKVGAEIGIQKGRMTKHILGLLPSIKKYYAIDPWLWTPEYKETVNPRNQERWNQDEMNFHFTEFKRHTKVYKDRIITLKMTSKEASKHIPDGSLDFIFIDGNHSYEFAKEDIQLYLPKIKKGGLISGHDYGHNVGGVKEAVNEIFKDFSTGSNKTWWKWI